MADQRIIMVTGGCGFIGTNFIRLVRTARPGWRIINLDKLTYAGNLANLDDIEEGEGYRFVRGDICDPELVDGLFREECCDTVIHFAAESHVDRSITGPAQFIQTNITGTFTLLESAKKSWLNRGWQGNDPCFLQVSTDEVYGSLGPDGMFTEATAYDPRSPYSASKASADHLVNAYLHTYDLPVLITNCSNNYGPYQFPEKLIPLVLYNCLRGRKLPLYGDGKNVRDWLYVEDHCLALLRVIEQGRPGRKYNIGGNAEKENIEVVKTLCDLVDEKLGPLSSGAPRRSLINYVSNRAGHDRRYAIDARRIGDELGWAPLMSFEEGIRKTIDWYLSHEEWVNRVVDGSYQEYYARIHGDE